MIWNEKRLLIFNYENENFCKTMLQKDYFTFSPDMNYFARVCFDCPVTVRLALNQTQWGNTQVFR